MTQRIGLLGGTFNPIHLGHLVLAEEARERLTLDEVWFIPVAVPPLKDDPELASATDRLRMVELAIADQPAFRACDVEIRRGGRSYTIDTLRAMRAEHGAARHLVCLVGADACAQLPAWREWATILTLCEFVVAVRPGYRLNALPDGVRRLEIPLLDISATDIRRRLAQGRSIRFLIPEAVRRYVLDHRLYAT